MPWIRPLLLTMQLMAGSVLVAALLGLTIAFALSLVSTRRRVGSWIVAYCLAAMVACLSTPLILHAAAWEATAGKFGWLTFSQSAARTYQGLAGSYSGLVACIWIHGLFGSAMVSLAAWFATRRVPREVVDVSLLDGGPIWAWWFVRLPIAGPWVVTALFATAVLAATEMTVVDLYGVRTLADEFYLFHAVDPSLLSILSILVIPTVLSIVAVGVWLVSRRPDADVGLIDVAIDSEGSDGQGNHVGTADSALPDSPGGRLAAWSAAFVAVALTTMMCLFPLVGLVIKTGQQVRVSAPESSIADASDSGQGAAEPTAQRSDRQLELRTDWSLGQSVRVLAEAPSEFRREYWWTGVLAVGAVFICVPIGWALACWTRGRPRRDLAVLAVSLTAVLIPGPLVGLGLVRLFSLPVPGFYPLFHQSVLPTLIALSVRAVPVAYWVMRAGYAGLDGATLDAAKLDFSFWKRLFRVEGPLLARPLLIAGFATAVVACGDVPVTLPVAPPEVVTVGTRLFSLLHSGARERESALAFWYLAATLIAAGLLSIRWKRAN